MSNQITAYFKGRTGVAESVYQNDYGMVLYFDGIYLPANFDCYFSIFGSDTAIPGVGADNRVAIPNTVLSHEGNVTVHIPLHTGSDDSEVEYVVYLKVIGRARPEDDGTPVQMTAIERALALLSQPITNIEEIVNEALSFTGETFDEMRSDLQGDYDTFAAGVNDDISDMQDDIAGFKTEIRGDISDVEADFTVLQGQFDTAVAGVTTDTEVTDIRVGADGVTDTTAGASVRRQFTALKEDFDKAIKIDYEGTSYYKKETIDDNALLIDIRDSFKSLTDEAINGITYGDLFGSSHNITAFLDFESGSYSPAVRNSGDPTVTNEDSYSNPYSLKCFGSTSQQVYAEVPFEANHYYYLAVFAKVSRYSQGWAGALFSSSYPANFSRTTSGFELASRIISTDGTGSTYIYFGSGSSANLDAYLDNVTFIDITNMFDDFSDTTAIQNTMDTLFKEYVDICNSNYNAKTFRIPTQNKSTFIGAILGATSPSDRWTAMKELYEVGQRLLDDPSYVATDSDLPHASQGAVCLMPKNFPSMYQQYPLDIIYSKNGTTQSLPASTTKVMTLVTGLDFVSDIYERVTIIATDIQDGSPVFQDGDIVTIKDLIYGMLLPSSNTCANTFARVCGDKILTSQNGSGTHSTAECNSAFIAQMAVKSAELGLANSVWDNPSGLSSGNKTTVTDMLRIIIEACSYNEIQKVWNKKNYTINVKGSNARTETIQTSVTDVSFETDYYIFGGKTGTLYLDDDTIVTLMLIAKEK